jgi:hypothetical protein
MGKKISDLAEYLQQNSVQQATSDCRLWTGSVNKGYGRLKYRGKALRAARAAYAIANGLDVDELDGDVIPSCGNSLCINDRHLHLGKCNARRHAVAAEAARVALAVGRKRCPGCDIVQPIGNFNKNVERVDGYQNYCRVCDNAQRRKWYGKENNAETSREYNVAKRLSRREWLRALKATLQCEACGETFAGALDFHHRDPSEKEFSISKMIGQTISITRIEAEIAKCTVLCSNCHRKLHHRDRLDPIAQWQSSPLSTERPGIVTP